MGLPGGASEVGKEETDGERIDYNRVQRRRRETRAEQGQEFGIGKQGKCSGLKSSEWALVSKVAER